MAFSKATATSARDARAPSTPAQTAHAAQADRPRSSSPGEERTPRARLEVEVSLVSDSQFFAGLGGDVSDGGLFVATYRPLAIGATIDLEIELPDGPVKAAGRVRWTRDAHTGAPAGVGVAFVALSSEHRARIEEFCRARPPLYYEA